MTGFAGVLHAGALRAGAHDTAGPGRLLRSVARPPSTTRWAKNMIGAFYQPLKVVCDLQTLQSLPAREPVPGWRRSSSTGRSPTWPSWTGSRPTCRRCAPASPALAHAVRRSCEIKASVVGQTSARPACARSSTSATLGHAIEAGMGYGQWPHGEAVGCGMVMATRLSQRWGWWTRRSPTGWCAWRRRRDRRSSAGVPRAAGRRRPTTRALSGTDARRQEGAGW